MKILKPGKDHVWEIECTGKGNSGKGCEALLGVDREDFRYYSGGGYLDRNPEVVIRCPKCGTTTDVNRADYPQHHRDLTEWTKAWSLGEEDD